MASKLNELYILENTDTAIYTSSILTYAIVNT